MPQPPTLIALSTPIPNPADEYQLPSTIAPVLRIQPGRDHMGRSVYAIVPAHDAFCEEYCTAKDAFVGIVQAGSTGIFAIGNIALAAVYATIHQGSIITIPWNVSSCLLGISCTLAACTAEQAVRTYCLLNKAESLLREKADRRPPVIMATEETIVMQPVGPSLPPPAYGELFQTTIAEPSTC